MVITKQKRDAKKKGVSSKRKIPILAQESLPMHELSSLTVPGATSSSSKAEIKGKRVGMKGISSTGSGDELRDDMKSSLMDKEFMMEIGEDSSIFGEDFESRERLQQLSKSSLLMSKKRKEFLEDEGKEEEVDELDWGSKEESIRSRIETARDHLKDLVGQFNETQMNRYETFRRSGLQRPLVKKWIQSYLGHAVHPNIVIAIAGVAKVYVGELVEQACDVRDEWGETGQALTPSDIKEAYRRLTQSSGLVSIKNFNFCSKKRII